MVKIDKQVYPTVVRSRDRVQLDFLDESLTHQSFREQCTINDILRGYETSNLLDTSKDRQGLYGDFSSITDYHTACNMVLAADESFMSLPANLRAQFNNDPGTFLDFVTDPKNAAKVRELGLSEDQSSDVSAKGDSKNSPKVDQDEAV